MRKKAWFFKNQTLLGILGVMLVFGTLATGCPTESSDPEPTTYTVTFDVDDGSAVPNQTVEEGKKVTKPTAPTKTGYTFVNWYKEAAKTNLWNFDTDTVTANITLYAKWVAEGSVQSFTVTFDVDGGTTVPNQTVEEGKKVTKPTAPTKTGYTFVNWYKEAAKTNLWNFDTDTVTANITLYAKWVEGTVQSFTVTFDTDGGSAVSPQTVVQNQKVPKPADPTKSGYIFGGWYNKEAKWDFSTNTVTAAITLKAKWQESVTVTFNTNGGSTIDPVTVAKDEVVNLLRYTPTKSGHVFDGWYTDAAFTTPAQSELTVTANITLYAKWTSTSDLAGYAGVWRNDKGEVYLLQADATAWRFTSDGRFNKTTWATSQIDGGSVTFNEDKTEFNEGNSKYTKNTTETKTPAAATGALLGTWINSGILSIELKSDKTAVLTSYNGSITLGYCAESDKLYLLAPTENLVIISIAITDGKLKDFSKSTSDSTLAGIWKLTKEDGQDYYWNLDKDGKGTFHTLGASLPVSFTVTEDKKIGGYSYTVSDNTLTIPKAGYNSETEQGFDLVLTKVASVSGTGAGGDSNLHGTWVAEGSNSITFNSNGTGEQRSSESLSYIWKANDNTLYLYYLQGLVLLENKPMSYTVSGSTCTINGMVLTKQ